MKAVGGKKRVLSKAKLQTDSVVKSQQSLLNKLDKRLNDIQESAALGSTSDSVVGNFAFCFLSSSVIKTLIFFNE